jgi:hypothetical protein
VVERHDDHYETAQDIDGHDPRVILPRHRLGSAAGTFPFRVSRGTISKLQRLRHSASGHDLYPNAMSREFSGAKAILSGLILPQTPSAMTRSP